MEKQLKDYNEELRNKENDIQRIVDELAQQNKAAQEEAKKIYREVIKAKNREKMYLEKAAELKENVPDSDTILYSRQLPRLVMRHSKLDGGKPLKDFRILSQWPGLCGPERYTDREIGTTKKDGTPFRRYRRKRPGVCVYADYGT